MERKREQVLALLFLDDLELFIFLQSEHFTLYIFPPCFALAPYQLVWYIRFLFSYNLKYTLVFLSTCSLTHEIFMLFNLQVFGGFMNNFLVLMSNSLQPHEPQHSRPPCLSWTPGVYPNSCPLSQWCHPTISSSVIPFCSCLQSFQHQGLFKWVSSLHQVAKVLEFQLQHQSFQRTPRTEHLG